MKTLRECIKEAQDKGVALGHFNISTIDVLWAIFNAARLVDVPIIIGTSEGEDSFIGHRQAVALVRSLREEFDYPIYINADHHYSFDEVKEAVDAGYDMVIFDGAKLPIEENIKISKQCVDYARSVNPEIMVEGEVGYIGTSSNLMDKLPEDVSFDEESFPTGADAKAYVEATGMDAISPGVGNIHGMLKGASNPHLSIDTIKDIRASVSVPMVLHGGSGLTDEDFQKAIKAGFSVIHINTEIRVAWKNAVKLSLQDNPDQVAPYKILKPVEEAVQKVVERRLKLFNFIK